MWTRIFSLLPLAAATAFSGAGDFNGKWALALEGDQLGRAGWLEVRGAGSGEIQGSAVSLAPGGQLDAIEGAEIREGELRFSIERRVGRGEKKRLVRSPTRARLENGLLRGVTVRNGNEIRWTGRREPQITDTADGHWREAAPIVLFDGAGLSRWRTLHPGRESEWYVEDGVMKNHDHADMLVSKDKFWNFRLHAEYRVHPGMNGGIGLRGRYEIQILDDYGRPPSKGGNGALYSRIAPAVNASKPAGEWQSFDITLIGRDLTVVLNGKTIIDRQKIEGFTAMATDSHSGRPGPVTLQGDHGAVEFRKIAVTPLVR